METPLMKNKLTILMAALLMATTLGLSNAQPASANGATSTRNIIIGAAVLAGLIFSSNGYDQYGYDRSGFDRDGYRCR